jgi:penicillin-binding protein 2
MAAEALEEREIRPSASFDCNGSYILFDTTFGCWKWSGHGKIDLETSLVESCDVYYYKLGEKVGVLKIAEWARRFGLGEKVRIGLVEEKAGLIPDPEWKRRRYNKPWYDGETLLVSVGQGAMQITPLQAVLIPASVANSGTIMRPQLIHHLKDENGVPKTEFKPQVMAENIMGPSTVGFLRRAMEKVVEDKAGTAYKYARSGYVRIAAKTGTSEVSKKYKRKPLEEIPYKYRDHAWFVAYAPAHAPRIAVVVLVEHGGSGGAIAGPIARAIIEDYFRIVASDDLRPHKKGS